MFSRFGRVYSLSTVTYKRHGILEPSLLCSASLTARHCRFHRKFGDTVSHIWQKVCARVRTDSRELLLYIQVLFTMCSDPGYIISTPDFNLSTISLLYCHSCLAHAVAKALAPHYCGQGSVPSESNIVCVHLVHS